MSILLQRLNAADNYHPLDRVEVALRLREPIWFATIVRLDQTVPGLSADACSTAHAADAISGVVVKEKLARLNGAASAAELVEVGSGNSLVSVFLRPRGSATPDLFSRCRSVLHQSCSAARRTGLEP